MISARSIMSFIGLAFLLALVPCNFSQATIHDVSIIDFAFVPQVDTIAQGDTVRWTNNGAAPHTSTSDQGFWDSGTLTNGQSFLFQFSSAGTFPYHCNIHPAMTATMVVTPAGSVPVFSNWTMMALVLLLMALGIWMLGRRRSIARVKSN